MSDTNWQLRETDPFAPNCGACPGDGSICPRTCRAIDESPNLPPVYICMLLRSPMELREQDRSEAADHIEAQQQRIEALERELAEASKDAAQEPEHLTTDSAPFGTKAPAIMGGHWYKNAHGWKWNGPDSSGGTFPRPGGDWTGQLITPPAPVSPLAIVQAALEVAISALDSHYANYDKRGDSVRSVVVANMQSAIRAIDPQTIIDAVSSKESK